MEFEQWAESIFKFGTDPEYGIARAAWDAGVKHEREACANLCELQAVGHRDGFGNHCAAMIRERSNV